MPKSFISLIRKTINISYICYQAIFLLYKIKTNKMATVPTLLFLQMHLLRIQDTCSRRNSNEMRVWQTCLRKSTCIRWLELDLKYELKPADELHTKNFNLAVHRLKLRVHIWLWDNETLLLWTLLQIHPD